MEEQQQVEREESETYELDLENSSDTPIDKVFDEAVAAVERGDQTSEPEVEIVTEGDDDAASGDADGARIAALETEVQDLRERLARNMADFDNFRKRSTREKADIRRYAVSEPMRDFLGAVDNIERAMAASGSADDLKLGLEMTIRQLEDMLKRYGVEPVDAVGKPFDPTVHEAVSRSESDEVTEPTVVSEMQRGYRIHERLLRPSLVTVAVPRPASDSES